MSARETVILSLSLPVPLSEFCAITEALTQLHGEGKVFVRENSNKDMLEFFKRPTEGVLP